MSAVPEPSSALLVGLAGLLAITRSTDPITFDAIITSTAGGPSADAASPLIELLDTTAPEDRAFYRLEACLPVSQD